ncbi:Hypothetical protein Tpal_441 [Trichococcus palustris]|uniref:DUF2929 domain-containing protein n=1 Tax=Trichococcus palustris TaxID=140314 RepID=A0A143Y8A6_9LACT|nr:YjzD family protein [Trichococcus palustris]CZQ83402.1 Hypothetical protein Tpal_441 [Trichococcus palustris]SFK69756.1 Protein of unknown function [Trichococcus palustris]
MKYIMTIIWGFILGQVSFYIGSALTGGSYDFTYATITGLFTTLIVILISALLPKQLAEAK